MQQAADKMVEEANGKAAEAERVNSELAQRFQMLNIQKTQDDNQATTQPAESQRIKQIAMQQAAENESLQKQLADMQKLLGSQMA